MSNVRSKTRTPGCIVEKLCEYSGDQMFGTIFVNIIENDCLDKISPI